MRIDGGGFRRSGFGEIDVYPSHAVLRTSLTVLLVGAYLFIVGVLGPNRGADRRTGTVFQFQAFVVLLGFALLAVFSFSNRAPAKYRLFR